MPIISLIQFRRGSAEEWAIANPVLAAGEPGIDYTNNHFKIGDGNSDWLTLKPIGNTLNFGVYDIYTNINSNYVTSIDDHIIFVDASDNEIEITIPEAANIGGKQYVIKKIGGMNNIVVSVVNNGTIDGESSAVIRYNYDSITVISNNLNWFII